MYSERKIVIGNGNALEQAVAAWQEALPDALVQAVPVRQDAARAFDLSVLDGLECDGATAFVAWDQQFLNLRRFELMGLLKARGLRLPALVHPSALVARSAQIGENTWVGAGVLLGANVKLGVNCVIGAGSNLGVGCDIGHSSWLAAGVLLGDGVKLGAHVTLGLGVSVDAGVEWRSGASASSIGPGVGA